MCFRPADASADSGANKCPECGKTLQVMGGMELSKCPFCKCDLTAHAPAAAPAPGAPSAPGAPAAPGAPKPPQA